jgi:hypothetical protein
LSDRLLGDGLVPVASALGKHARAKRQLRFPAGQQWVAHATNHMELLSDQRVYAHLKRWLADS